MNMSNLKDHWKNKTIYESGAPPYNATPEIVATMDRATAELKACAEIAWFLLARRYHGGSPKTVPI